MEATLLSFCIKQGARFGGGLLLAATLVVPVQATPISIDNFAQPTPAQFFLVPTGSSPSLLLTNSVNGPIGGQRDLLFHVVGQGAVNSASGLIGQDTSFGLNSMQLGTNGTAPTVTTLQYSGPNNQNTSTLLVNAHALGGAAGIDLTGGGTNDRFRFQFVSSDAQPTTGLDVALTLTSPGGSSSASAIALNSLAPFAVDIPFAQLVGNVALNHVDSITVVFNGVRQTPNVDFEIQSITAVPEPLTCLTMAIGGALLCVASLRRHRG